MNKDRDALKEARGFLGQLRSGFASREDIDEAISKLDAALAATAESEGACPVCGEDFVLSKNQTYNKLFPTCSRKCGRKMAAYKLRNKDKLQ